MTARATRLVNGRRVPAHVGAPQRLLASQIEERTELEAWMPRKGLWGKLFDRRRG